MVFYTFLTKSEQLKIPVEFIRAVGGDNGIFSITYDPACGEVTLVPDTAYENEKISTVPQPERGIMPGTWSYKCRPICMDIMAYVVLPQILCAHMEWDKNITLAVSQDTEKITVKASDISPEDIPQERKSGVYVPPKPKKERFIEVYCRNAEKAWGKGMEFQRGDVDKLECAITDTLVAVTKDDRTSIKAENIGRFDYAVKIANFQEAVTCLVKTGDSFAEQAANIYDTILYTSIV